MVSLIAPQWTLLAMIGDIKPRLWGRFKGLGVIVTKCLIWPSNIHETKKLNWNISVCRFTYLIFSTLLILLLLVLSFWYYHISEVRGTWRMWSNIISIRVHFSTTFKLHNFIYIKLVMSLYMYILQNKPVLEKNSFSIEITIVNCVWWYWKPLIYLNLFTNYLGVFQILFLLMW